MRNHKHNKNYPNKHIKLFDKSSCVYASENNIIKNIEVINFNINK
jgi:hypothetical protein